MDTLDLTPAVALSKAADLIEKRGWTQHDWANEDGCLCAQGALYVALGGTLVFDDVGLHLPDLDLIEDHLSVVARPLALHVSPSGDRGNVARWNDEAGRTQAEVVAALRAAAVKAGA